MPTMSPGEICASSGWASAVPPGVATMPYCAQSAEYCRTVAGAKPEKTSGVSMGSRKPPPGIPAARAHSTGTGKRRPCGAPEFAADAANESLPADGKGYESATAVPGRGGASWVGSESMLSIGVTPAKGSFTNMPNFKETAPASFPSMYTGLPLMPATTPVCSTFGPFNCTKMMDCFGPIRFGMTPMTTKSKFSTWSPAKMVRA
jgi:hypothetical protein